VLVEAPYRTFESLLVEEVQGQERQSSVIIFHTWFPVRIAPLGQVEIAENTPFRYWIAHQVSDAGVPVFDAFIPQSPVACSRMSAMR
jgi:hypothetical protein